MHIYICILKKQSYLWEKKLHICILTFHLKAVYPHILSRWTIYCVLWGHVWLGWTFSVCTALSRFLIWFCPHKHPLDSFPDTFAIYYNSSLEKGSSRSVQMWWLLVVRQKRLSEELRGRAASSGRRSAELSFLELYCSLLLNLNSKK